MRLRARGLSPVSVKVVAPPAHKANGGQSMRLRLTAAESRRGVRDCPSPRSRRMRLRAHGLSPVSVEVVAPPAHKANGGQSMRLRLTAAESRRGVRDCPSPRSRRMGLRAHGLSPVSVKVVAPPAYKANGGQSMRLRLTAAESRRGVRDCPSPRSRRMRLRAHGLSPVFVEVVAPPAYKANGGQSMRLDPVPQARDGIETWTVPNGNGRSPAANGVCSMCGCLYCTLHDCSSTSTTAKGSHAPSA